ncbi:unnamed protein product [Soboliphyme baturini]|uniref:Phospholipid/glycerol acyltransferase domain-containing protein n=1 Tax=Soboliphyme baturini TaxID=241478 RepID=A0A3P8E1I1_9BILA|nr:unnamed protein product [Soboliphyme baturini]
MCFFQGSLIKKEATSRILRKVSGEEPQGSPVFTVVDDSLDLVKAGMEAVIEDEVTSRFSTEQLTSWNLLTRSSYGYHRFSLKLTAIWFVGLAFRYLILFPINLKRSISSESMENVARPRGICVANHTSPIDVLVLAQDNCYALVGQKQGGFLGFLQKSLSGLSSHVWFEREEASDRYRVRQRLQEHVDDPTKLPILIFPEGTCINNTSVMMFKKGSFEVGGTIYPVAIKYDPRFGDAFWNSSKQSYFQYLVMMMTSWALVCDVWYLPPMTKQEDESSITFANRVKKAIAEAGGLVDLQWYVRIKLQCENRFYRKTNPMLCENLKMASAPA